MRPGSVFPLVAAILAPVAVCASPGNPLGFPEYVQRVEATFATEADAAVAEVSFSPLPDGTRFAFFCRWDDNNAANLRKAEMMNGVGVKGTFFLFGGGTDYLRDMGRRLLSRGHAVGNHSLTHPSNMNKLPPNEVFRQILLGRIGVETNTDWTVTAFAMPWGWWCKGEPERHGLFTRSLADTGHLWDDGHDTAHFSANDKEPDPTAFRTGFAKATAQAEASRGKLSADFGTHAWDTAEGTAVQGRCLAESLPETGVMRTHANAFAAYRYSVRNGHVGVVERKGRTVTFEVTRFPPSFLGDPIPVGLAFTHPPLAVRCETADVRPSAAAGCWTLPHNRGLGMPQTIRGLPPETLGFDVDEATGTARIALPPEATAWSGVCAVVMAPPMWRRGRIVATCGGTFSLGDRSDTPADLEGVRVYAVSVDYVDESGVTRRVWSVLARKGDVPPPSAVTRIATARKVDAPAADAEPLLVFGVVSDTHVGHGPQATTFLENALQWLAGRNVDAVLFAGDLSHSGLIPELEAFADVWNRVFPEGRGPDGRKVELMLVTGNHDVDAWGGRWKGFSEAELQAKRFHHGDNPGKTWRRLFGQPWELVWRREVKGFTFLGAQWRSTGAPVEAFLAEVAPTLDPDKPFFFCQHEHPAGTCHGDYSDGDDRGEARRALAPFPNAVALSGHSHCALSDERGVWQGTFTSIGAGCTRGPRTFLERPEYANASASWHRSHREKAMANVSNEVDGRDVGGDFDLVEVFADHLVVHRRSVTFDEPIGPAWAVPLPARPDGPLSFARRAAEGTPPQFAGGAAATAVFCPGGHDLESVGHRGEPCVAVTFPHAGTTGGHRVFDYEIRAEAEGADPVVRRVMAPGFSWPEEHANLPGTCLFLKSELPPSRPVRFTIAPRDCFGGKGGAIFVDLP